MKSQASGLALVSKIVRRVYGAQTKRRFVLFFTTLDNAVANSIDKKSTM
jgi:hypothetical protein